MDEPARAWRGDLADADMKLEIRIRQQLGAFALDIDFSADAPVVALFGKSGSGKSSVVNAIAGLSRPDAGRIVADGTVLFDSALGIDLPPEARRVGYVFQEGLLFPHMSVWQNLLYGQRTDEPAGIGLGALAELLGIAHLLDRRPASLSGGEKQRVAIGRAILARPRLLLMDEPLASLDTPRRSEILRLVERLRDELGVRIVYVSHSIGEVTRLADAVVLVNEGRVVAHGPVEEIFNRADLRPYTGRFEGGALIEAEAVAHDEAYFLTTFRFGEGAELVAPGLDAPLGSRVRMRIRARDLTLATQRPAGFSIRNVLPGEVVHLDPGKGAIAEVRVRVAGKELPVRISRKSVDEMQLQPGKPIFVLIKAIAFDKRSMGFTA